MSYIVDETGLDIRSFITKHFVIGRNRLGIDPSEYANADFCVWERRVPITWDLAIWSGALGLGFLLPGAIWRAALVVAALLSFFLRGLGFDSGELVPLLWLDRNGITFPGLGQIAWNRVHDIELVYRPTKAGGYLPVGGRIAFADHTSLRWLSFSMPHDGDELKEVRDRALAYGANLIPLPERALRARRWNARMRDISEARGAI